MNKNNHQIYMQRALELAKQGWGNTSPNPMVGCVIVKDDRIIAEGYHQKAGLDHAEKDALKNTTKDVKGATLYCTLEPCCHTNKKTPPCTNAIINAGIAEVVIGSVDPNPEVAGKGIEQLKSQGIRITQGILQEECDVLNEVFFLNMKMRRPFFHLKWAQTLDGFTASTTGDSKWITGEEARADVHIDRSKYDAILVGANTARLDNPELTVRMAGQATICKKRIILSQSKKLPASLKLLNDKYKEQTHILDCSIQDLPQRLWQMGIRSVYVEGGAKIHTELIKAKLVDRLSIYIAPKLLGDGLSALNDFGHKKIAEAMLLKNFETNMLGDDIKYCYRSL